MAGEGELVLGLAGDAPLLRGDRHVLAHRQAGARLGVAGHLDADVGGAEREGRLGAVAGRALGAVEAQQLAAQLLGDDDGRVRGRVDAAGDARVDLAEGDLVRDEDRGLQPGAAGLGDVVGGRRRRQARAEHRLAGEVEVAAVLEDRAGDDLAEPLAGRPWRATRPSIAAVSMSWLEASA